MPRRRFDPDQALERAMLLFWQKGYEATSAQDLVDTMNINRGSLYATFGSKRQLYLQALERYLARDRARLADAIAGTDALQGALGALLAHYADQLASDPQRRGCFMANACAELTAHDDDVAARLADELRVQETMLADAFRAARLRGESLADSEEDDLAAYLVTAIQGLRIVAKTTPDREHLGRVVGLVLDTIFGTAAPAPARS